MREERGEGLSRQRSHIRVTWDPRRPSTTGGRPAPLDPNTRDAALSVAALPHWLVLGAGEARPCGAQLERKGLAGGGGEEGKRRGRGAAPQPLARRGSLAASSPPCTEELSPLGPAQQPSSPSAGASRSRQLVPAPRPSLLFS